MVYAMYLVSFWHFVYIVDFTYLKWFIHVNDNVKKLNLIIFKVSNSQSADKAIKIYIDNQMLEHKIIQLNMLEIILMID